MDVIGSLAFFSNGTSLPLGELSPEDCVRFYEGIKGAPARAADWSQSKSLIGKKLVGGCMRYKGNDLVPDDLKGRPEPQFYMVFYTTTGMRADWDSLSGAATGLLSGLQADYPGMVQGLLFGVQEQAGEDVVYPSSMRDGWLVADPRAEFTMDEIRALTPSKSFGIVVMTRNGLGIYESNADDADQVKVIFDKLRSLLAVVDEDNPNGWDMRARYWKAVRPVIYEDAKADPVLLGNPLVASKLRLMKIYQVDATFQIAADGSVNSVVVQPGGLAPNTVAMLQNGFKRVSRFAPAVDHGKFVEGTYVYHLEVAH